MKTKKYIKILTKELLYSEYIINNKTTEEIAIKNNLLPSTILNYLKYYNISRRKCGARKGHIPWNKNKKLHYLIWNKGKHIQSNTGKTHFKKGRTNSKEHRILSGLRWLGKLNPRFKGGVSDEEKIIRGSIEYKIWQLLVYRKNKGICQICGIRCNNKNIVAHHIKSFKDFTELRFDINNGQTLCRSCHAKLHIQ